MSGFARRSAAALADPARRENVRRFSERAHDHRTESVARVDFEALRDAGERIRSRSVAEMPALIDEFQANL